MYRDYYGKAIGAALSKINNIYLLINYAVKYIDGVFLYAGYFIDNLFIILILVIVFLILYCNGMIFLAYSTACDGAILTCGDVIAS